MSTRTIDICIVGAGPRGTVALERVCANAPLLSPGQDVHVHVVDPYPVGGGRVWKFDQPRELLMNTVAGDVTVFTDQTVTCEGPLTPGPTQYQWARMVADGLVTDVSDEAKAEAAQMEAWSYASRAFQGEYLGWSFRHIVERAPAGVSVSVHQTRAVSVTESPDGMQEVRLEGEDLPLRVDAVVLAQGHYDVAPTTREQHLIDFAARHGLHYVAPNSPAEADLSWVTAGEPVIVRGLGLNFYDYMILLSEGRGGHFVTEGDGLRYLPSGEEPVMYAGSGRGMPYRARAEIKQEVVPRYKPDFITATEIAELRLGAGTGRTDFLRDLFPLVAKEVAWVYYRALLKDTAPEGHARLVAEFPGLSWGSPRMERLIEELVPDPELRFDWKRLDRPADGIGFAGQAAFREWITAQLAEDLRHSRLGPERSAVKAAAAVMRDLREEVRAVISHQGISGASYRDHIDRWFSGLNNYAASGPPATRVAQLLALVRAGIVEPLGPRMKVSAEEDDGVFLASSPDVPGTEVRATALVEAHLPLTDVRRATDPLLASLRAAGECRAHFIPDADGGGYETGGLDVTESTFQVVRGDGTPHPARFSYGPPVESVQWVTAIGARPHVNSRTLLQGDSIARSCLRQGMARLARLDADDAARRETATTVPLAG
ncbi:FAD/NAD(P)-binding protein [Streptomyces sp. NEAU-sy36]|uniref:FAD/NAD(P)-binding protein n=1 Tax=unclassified Streptomyces TaxID=2593676 RepID=UPI0015D5C588|nr:MULTISPECIES: FAD/NAD(P)-binding protein [unclassified Streptomyces]QLJ04522.1 FAD/NAD(P)-binding protein [Streptomyces sp. NEAU-sy36]